MMGRQKGNDGPEKGRVPVAMSYRFSSRSLKIILKPTFKGSKFATFLPRDSRWKNRQL
jgi:hypothetical protein